MLQESTSNLFLDSTVSRTRETSCYWRDNPESRCLEDLFSLYSWRRWYSEWDYLGFLHKIKSTEVNDKLMSLMSYWEATSGKISRNPHPARLQNQLQEWAWLYVYVAFPNSALPRSFLTPTFPVDFAVLTNPIFYPILSVLGTSKLSPLRVPDTTRGLCSTKTHKSACLPLGLCTIHSQTF